MYIEEDDSHPSARPRSDNLQITAIAVVLMLIVHFAPPCAVFSAVPGNVRRAFSTLRHANARVSAAVNRKKLTLSLFVTMSAAIVVCAAIRSRGGRFWFAANFLAFYTSSRATGSQSKKSCRAQSCRVTLGGVRGAKSLAPPGSIEGKHQLHSNDRRRQQAILRYEGFAHGVATIQLAKLTK